MLCYNTVGGSGSADEWRQKCSGMGTNVMLAKLKNGRHIAMFSKMGYNIKKFTGYQHGMTWMTQLNPKFGGAEWRKATTYARYEHTSYGPTYGNGHNLND